MTENGHKSLPSIGFLTVCERAGEGLFGGYLVLNTSARPLEFHCTAPVRPNRAQEILYGPTLKPFLYGEHIGRALLAKAASEPLLVCTDAEPALSVSLYAASPVVLLMPAAPQEAEVGQWPEKPRLRFDPPHEGGPPQRLLPFPLGNHWLAVGHGRESDRERVIRRWRPYADDFDLSEPFDRIRAAIDEARRRAR
jgi:hypothetical protein